MRGLIVNFKKIKKRCINMIILTFNFYWGGKLFMLVIILLHFLIVYNIFRYILKVDNSCD